LKQAESASGSRQAWKEHIMGSSVPPKYMLPSAPYGASQAANTLNPAQQSQPNPQLPLLPSTFVDPGTINPLAKKVGQ
jgi:hypothetical protein